MDAVMMGNPYFNHLDFLWSIEVNERVNDPIRETLRKTDDMDWKYSGPNLPQSKDIFNASDGYIGASGDVNISDSTGDVSDSGNVNISSSAANVGDSGHFNISYRAGDVGEGGHFNISYSAGDAGDSENGGSGSTDNIGSSGGPSDLDYLAKNLGKIIADAMPRPMDREGDAADFERERVLQETLLTDAIEFVRSVQKKYGSTLVWQESSTHRRIEQVVTSPRNDAD